MDPSDQKKNECMEVWLFRIHKDYDYNQEPTANLHLTALKENFNKFSLGALFRVHFEFTMLRHPGFRCYTTADRGIERDFNNVVWFLLCICNPGCNTHQLLRTNTHTACLNSFSFFGFKTKVTRLVCVSMCDQEPQFSFECQQLEKGDENSEVSVNSKEAVVQ